MKKNGLDQENVPSPQESEPAKSEGRKKEHGADSTEMKSTPELSAETVAELLKSIEEDRRRLAPLLDAPQEYGELLDQTSDAKKEAFHAWAATVEDKWRACYAQLLRAAEVSKNDSRFGEFRRDVSNVQQNLADNWEWSNGDVMDIRRAGRSYSDDTPFIGSLSGKRGRAVARLMDSPEVEAYNTARWEELKPRLEAIGSEYIERKRDLEAKMNGVDIESEWSLYKIRDAANKKPGEVMPTETAEALSSLRKEIGGILFCLRGGSGELEKGSGVLLGLKNREGVESRLRDLQGAISVLEAQWPHEKKLTPEEARTKVEKLRRAIQELNEKDLKEQGE